MQKTPLKTVIYIYIGNMYRLKCVINESSKDKRIFYFSIFYHVRDLCYFNELINYMNKCMQTFY